MLQDAITIIIIIIIVIIIITTYSNTATFITDNYQHPF